MKKLAEYHPREWTEDRKRHGELLEDQGQILSLEHPAVIAHGEGLSLARFSQIITSALHHLQQTHIFEAAEERPVSVSTTLSLSGRDLESSTELKDVSNGEGEYTLAVRLQGRLHIIRKGRPVFVVIGRGNGSREHSDDEIGNNKAGSIRDDDGEEVLYPSMHSDLVPPPEESLSTTWTSVTSHEDTLLVLLSSKLPERIKRTVDILGCCLFSLDSPPVLLSNLGHLFHRHLHTPQDLIKIIQVVRRVKTPYSTPRPGYSKSLGGSRNLIAPAATFTSTDAIRQVLQGASPITDTNLSLYTDAPFIEDSGLDSAFDALPGRSLEVGSWGSQEGFLTRSFEAEDGGLLDQAEGGELRRSGEHADLPRDDDQLPPTAQEERDDEEQENLFALEDGHDQTTRTSRSSGGGGGGMIGIAWRTISHRRNRFKNRRYPIQNTSSSSSGHGWRLAIGIRDDDEQMGFLFNRLEIGEEMDKSETGNLKDDSRLRKQSHLVFDDTELGIPKSDPIDIKKRS